MFFIEWYPLGLLEVLLEHLTLACRSRFLSNFSILSGPPSGVGDWIFGLLVSAVYGEHVRGTTVAYPTNRMPISLGQDFWRRSFLRSSFRE